MREVESHLQFIVVGILDDTLFSAVGYVGGISCILCAAADGEGIVVGETGTGDFLKPVC